MLWIRLALVVTGADVLPLFARQSYADQERVFKPGGSSMRRIVLATNVAETSLTVPGIRYVIDTGYARLNRYSYRNKVEQLQVEKISRASANQRAGRCGRVMSGICVRLYSEEDYLARPEFTDPEILRSSLAAVILRMKSLKIGAVEDFPFLDPPLPRMITDGYQLLAELGAVDDSNALTKVGWRLAKFPIDPKIARMILAAKDENCLREVLIIAAALSVQDPRERPFERQEAADRAHQRFQDERSDFLGYLKLWDFFDDSLKHKKSNRKLLAECKDSFLSHRRMREWREIHGQLHALVMETGLRPNEIPASYEEIHRALLAGLLGNIGFKSDEDGEYLGARGIKFSIFPGLSAEEGQAQMGRCSGIDGNNPALCALCGENRSCLGGKNRGRPMQKALLRSPLGENPGTGFGVRARDAVWPYCGAKTPGLLWRHQSAGSTRNFYSRGAGGGRIRNPGAVFQA